MLTRRADETGDPDDQMVGRCMTCNTIVRCRRRDCAVRTDEGFMGVMTCAPCPKVNSIHQDKIRYCGARVYMSKERGADD